LQNTLENNVSDIEAITAKDAFEQYGFDVPDSDLKPVIVTLPGGALGCYAKSSEGDNRFDVQLGAYAFGFSSQDYHEGYAKVLSIYDALNAIEDAIGVDLIHERIAKLLPLLGVEQL
jgi:hypothetical protein